MTFKNMFGPQDLSEQSSTKSLVETEKDVEIDPLRNVETPSPKDQQIAAHSSGDRTLVLMDLDNGLVGWESEEDPSQPKCASQTRSTTPLSYPSYSSSTPGLHEPLFTGLCCLSFIPFGFGLFGIFVPCQTCAVDAFLETSASAVAALVVMRSIFGGFLPLLGPAAYGALDWVWATQCWVYWRWW